MEKGNGPCRRRIHCRLDWALRVSSSCFPNFLYVGWLPPFFALRFPLSALLHPILWASSALFRDRASVVCNRFHPFAGVAARKRRREDCISHFSHLISSSHSPSYFSAVHVLIPRPKRVAHLRKGNGARVCETSSCTTILYAISSLPQQA